MLKPGEVRDLGDVREKQVMDLRRSRRTTPGLAIEPSSTRPGTSAAWFTSIAAPASPRAGARSSATWPTVPRPASAGCCAGKTPPPGAPEPEEFERISTVLGDAAIASSDAGRLKAWWFYRLLFSPDPLGERLTLMWHNHFATSNQKVGDPAAMRRQNEMFRRLAKAPFGELLESAVRDPALLVWLDAPANRKGHPNENLARELLELFSLGIGHYSEDDVKETARALTGWSVTDGEAREVPARHDDEPKTILGKTGKWHGSDVVRIVLDHTGHGRSSGVAHLRASHGGRL